VLSFGLGAAPTFTVGATRGMPGGDRALLSSDPSGWSRRAGLNYIKRRLPAVCLLICCVMAARAYLDLD
jgi:hypothetical protein